MKSRKEKLVVVIGVDFDVAYGGTQYLLEELAGTFDLRVYVYCRPGKAGFYRGLSFRCHVFPLEGPTWNWRGLRLGAKLFRLAILARMLLARRVLVTEARYLREAAWAKRIRGHQMVLTQFCQELYLPEDYPERWSWSQTQLKYAQAPDIVIDVDTFRAQIRADYYHLHKIPHVLVNTFPLSQMPTARPRGELWRLAQVPAPPSGTIVLVYAGSIATDKPLDRIMDAVAEIERPVFFLAFCSAAESRIKLFEDYAIKKLGPERCALRPAVPREVLRSILWEADIGVIDYSLSVLPTANQRYCAPTKLFEYMASGLAILGSDNDSLRTVIEGEGIGCCAQGDTPRDLARALQTLLAGDLGQMKQRARTLFAEKYSYEAQCQPEIQRITAEMQARRARADAGAIRDRKRLG